VVARVAVVDPLPMFRHGITAVLSAAGHAVDSPADPVAWAARRTAALMVLTMAGEAEWRLLALLRESRAIPAVIALTERTSAAAGARAIRAGARSVLPRDVAASMLRLTVEATMEGQSVMPAAVTTLLTSAAAAGAPAAQRMPATGAMWLRELASGSTVAQLATHSGYSERAMFRLLRALYRDMGVTSRVEAIMRARDWGWI
jgi:DNA-binding NarL/FixJ family response regulator